MPVLLRGLCYVFQPHHVQVEEVEGVREHVVNALRMAAHLAQGDNDVGLFPDLAELSRTYGSKVFPVPTSRAVAMSGDY